MANQRPNPNEAFPNPNLPRLCFIKNVVKNPQAIGFYEHLGFCTYKRTELDEEGSPYPLLYMRLAK